MKAIFLLLAVTLSGYEPKQSIVPMPSVEACVSALAARLAEIPAELEGKFQASCVVVVPHTVEN